MERVLELDFAVSCLKVDWDEVTAEEVFGLKILRQERDRFIHEKREEFREKQEQQALLNRQPR